MKTWGAFKYEIARIINDPQATKFPLDMLACVNDALRLLATSHTGVASVCTITGDGATASFPVPSNAVSSADIYRIRGIYDNTDLVWLLESDILPGYKMDEGYMIWPDGSLRINPVPAADVELSMYYVAYYDEVVDDDSTLDLPGWAYEAVKLYTAGRVIQTPTSQLTLLANFRTKVDSGNPEHNPMLILSKYYIAQFWETLNANHAPQLDKLYVRRR